MSALNDILDGVVTGTAALALHIGTNALIVVKRKLPKREETVDLSYQVTVSGAEQVDQIRRIAFNYRYSCVYTVEITLVTPNDRDQLLNLDQHAAWREAVRAKWQSLDPLKTLVPIVQMVDIARSPFLDRAQLKEGYDYNQVVLNVTTYENRS